MTAIRIHDISKRFDGAVALDRVSLQIEAGEMFFLLGPSGCGKTTLLRVLAGFVEPDAGDVFFAEERITSLPPRSRGAGMVFQTYALWPHLSVTRNVAYGLQVRGVAKAEIARRVEQALKLVRMEGFGERRPTQLSGGQQQRVALARALVIEPRVLLLDEPLSNLDARLRDEMREEIRRLHRETGLTMVYVTHDQKEALSLANRIAVMQTGKLVQLGPPLELYQRPANRFVAGFLGDCNFIPGKVKDGTNTERAVETPLGILVGHATGDAPKPGVEVVCAIRPQDLTLEPMGEAPNRFEATVDQLSFLGEMTHVRLLAGEAKLPVLIVGLPQTAARLKPGERVTLSAPPAHVAILQE
jgi:iron(III) transport system ATP-binding protein